MRVDLEVLPAGRARLGSALEQAVSPGRRQHAPAGAVPLASAEQHAFGQRAVLGELSKGLRIVRRMHDGDRRFGVVAQQVAAQGQAFRGVSQLVE